MLDGIAKTLPALVRSDKLQKRAARVGFDWSDVSGALAKCREEVAEIELALDQGDAAQLEDEAGDLLFAAVNVARLLGLDAEQTLRRGNEKFIRRFSKMEHVLSEQGITDLSEVGLERLESAWQLVKEHEDE